MTETYYSDIQNHVYSQKKCSINFEDTHTISWITYYNLFAIPRSTSMIEHDGYVTHSRL